jgi:hypothetical protein
MILLDGEIAKIAGSPEELYRELVNLKIAIAHSDYLMKIDKAAMETAVDALKNDSYEIEGIRCTKSINGIKTEKINNKGSQ